MNGYEIASLIPEDTSSDFIISFLAVLNEFIKVFLLHFIWEPFFFASLFVFEFGFAIEDASMSVPLDSESFLRFETATKLF